MGFYHGFYYMLGPNMVFHYVFMRVVYIILNGFTRTVFLVQDLWW